MDGFKEFTGKSLDDAISEACSFFDTSRERLELDIVQDAKSGIFGLVGARKAVVRARRVQLRSAMEDILGRNKTAEKGADASVEAEKNKKSAKENTGKDHGADAKKTRGAKGAKGEHVAPKPAKEARESKDGRESKDNKSARSTKPRLASTASAEGQEQRAAHAPKAPREEKHFPNEKAERDEHVDAQASIDKAERSERGERQDKAGQERNGKRAFSSEQERGRKERLARNQAKNQRDTSRRAPRQDVDDIYARPDDVDGNRVESSRSHTRRPDRSDRTDRADRHERHKVHPKHMHSPVPHAHTAEEGVATLFEDSEETENVRRIPLAELDQERLSQVTLEVVGLLTRYIVGEVPMSMKLHEGRIQVHLDCEENSGLLIGREGQTLASLQYIISRIVSREMDAVVRVQLDAGDYRTRQDEKLSDLALMLAERVRNTGKPHSTRPLSSYHRRIVHMALQEETDLLTRSSGDGPLKKVIIQRKRG